ncbi:MAG TPA: PH domain-containing protein [Acidimicrobiales bacterium]|nr:PH domain-containing protein [Acidimicrobiales bacterium]
MTTVESDTGWSGPSPKLWSMRRTEVLLLGALLLVVVLAATANGGPVAMGVGAGVAVVLTAVAGNFVRNRFRGWGYLEREEDLLVRRGVMIRRLSVVPYGRMQFVEVTAGVVERLFGISTVRLHTAAARSDARIPGLEPDEAARLRDRLAALGEAKAAGL